MRWLYQDITEPLPIASAAEDPGPERYQPARQLPRRQPWMVPVQDTLPPQVEAPWEELPLPMQPLPPARQPQWSRGGSPELPYVELEPDDWLMAWLAPPRRRKPGLPPFQLTEDPLPGLYTTFDVFHLPVFEPNDALAADAAGSRLAIVNLQGGNSRGGKPPNPGNGPGGKGPEKRQYHPGWIIGMARPLPMGTHVLGPTGGPPPEQEVWLFPGPSQPQPRRRRALQLGFVPPPLYFGAEDQDVDWLPPLERPVPGRPWRLPPAAWWPDPSREELITLDKWYSRWVFVPRRGPWPIPPLELRTELGLAATDEAITLDKWEPVRQPLPWRPKPIWLYPFQEEYEDPDPEHITLDKWYSRWPDPVRRPPWLELPIEVLDPDHLPDDPDLLIPLFGWRSWLQHPRWPLHQLVPPIEAFVNLETDEAPQPDKWENMTQRPPHRLVLPIALYPFAPEYDDPGPEVITLDKWYQALSLPVRPRPRLYGAHDPYYSDDVELITLDKWYQALSLPVWPPHLLRLVMGVLPEEPIPDIPGLPIDYWLTALQQPLNQPPRLPILYQPFQELYDHPYLREVPWPRRRKDLRFRRPR